MTMTADPIRPIYEMPGHPYYGPVRRLWCSLELLFADKGGVKTLEAALAVNATRRPRWDAHYADLMERGSSECGAGRIVMQQLLVAAEYLL